ncbi:L-threonine 3-dehydrogenase [Bienertia sinuspersici]
MTPRRNKLAVGDSNTENLSPPVVEFASFHDESYNNNINLDETLHDIIARKREKAYKFKRPPISAAFLKKVPRTIALRKRLNITLNEQAGTKGQGCRRRTSAAITLSEDRSNDLSLDDDEHSDEDNDVSFTNEDEIVSREDSDVSLTDEDEPEPNEDYRFMVHDNYDSYEDESWDSIPDEDENYLAKLYNNGKMFKDQDYGKIVLKPWQIFLDKNHLRDVIRDYCIQSGFSIIVERAINSMYTILCSALNGGWKLHASKLPDGQTWAIKYIKNHEHTCVGLESKNSMVKVKWGTRVLLEDTRASNDITTKVLNLLLFKRYGLEICKSTLYRVKKEALIKIHGGHDVSYSYLPNYCEVIRALNPGSIANCAWNQPDHPERPLAFSSIFICFKVALYGLFAGCRSLTKVDGAHLKGNYGGVLLSAIARDGNNEIFPFAWAIVSIEDGESWTFSIHHLKNVLQGRGRGDKWCIISDRALIMLSSMCGLRWEEILH